MSCLENGVGVEGEEDDPDELEDHEEEELDDAEKNFLTVSTVISVDLAALERLDGEPDTKSMASTQPEGKKKSFWKRIPALGLFLTVLKIVITSFGNLVIKKLEIDPIVLVFYRSFLLFSVAIPWTIAVDQAPFPTQKKLKTRAMLLLRGVIALLGTLSGTYAVQNMPLGDMQMITGLQPIFVSLSARLFLKEACGFTEFISILFMLAGITCVIKPPFIFPGQEAEKDSTFWIAAGLHLGATALAANVIVILRHFRTQSIASLTASREIVFIIVCFFIIMCANLELSVPSLDTKLKILGLAGFALISSTLNLLALKIEEANKIAMVDRCSAIIMAFLLDFYFFNDSPEYLTIIGICLVILSLLIIGLRKVWNSKKRRGFFHKRRGFFHKNILARKETKVPAELDAKPDTAQT